MIKKITYSAFATLLLIITMGFSVSSHYCDNQLINIAIDKVADTCCDNDDCCKVETTLIQLHEDGTSATKASIPAQVELTSLLPLFVIVFSTPIFEIERETFTLKDSPPPLNIQTVLSIIQSYLL